MSVYQEKILELVAIERNNGKSYLHIKISFEQDVELFWEIDCDTAENLISITDFNGNHKHRLSLHTTLNTNKKQYISTLTQTFRDKSDWIFFACSEDYKTALDSIKNAQSIHTIIELPFLSINLSTIEENKMEETNEVVIPKRSNFPFKWVSVVMMSIIFTLLFGYSNNPSKYTINNTTIAHAEVKIPEYHVEKAKQATKPVKVNSTQSSLPSIKLNDFLTYSLPEGYVALTFDDGPSKYTREIVDILKKYQVGGTFFFVGYNVKKYPDNVRYVYSNGYTIGDHSMTHPLMSKLSYDKQKDELLQSMKVIEDITHHPVDFFRPPYEAMNAQTNKVLHDYHEKMILWNRDTDDWKSRNAVKIVNYIRDTKASGSIILLHETQADIDALPKIIELLQEQKLKVVSLQ